MIRRVCAAATIAACLLAFAPRAQQQAAPAAQPGSQPASSAQTQATPAQALDEPASAASSTASAPTSAPASVPSSAPVRATPSEPSLALLDELGELEHSGIQTLLEPDSAVWIFEAPRFRKGNLEVRASWALFWLDRAQFESLSRELDERASGAPTDAERAEARASDSIFARMEGNPIAELAREVYLEGPIEYLFDGELVAHAGAFYLDLVGGHGWVADATFNSRQRFGGRPQTVRAHADWLRHSIDRSWRANSATITVCEYEEPHVEVSTGDLRLYPTEGDRRVPWRIELRKNRLHLFDALTIPLPYYAWGLDEDYKPTIDSLRFGNSGKFGVTLGASVNVDPGGVGRAINDTLGGDPDKYSADSSVRVSFLGSRGLLVDLGAEFKSPGRYWSETRLGVVPDRGEDKGLIRVDEDDRSFLRNWFRSRGRYFVDERQWFDLAVSAQSDPGVQSEFFEGEFQRYEQRDNYVHWRRAREQLYLNASVKVRVDDFRADTEELPSLGLYRGRAPLLALGGLDLLYSTEASAGYYRRLEGDPLYQSPFDPPAIYPDGLGEREVLRADNTHALELPIPLGVGALKLTPFARVRATAWSENVDEDDEPTRAAAFAGARLSSSFWKPLAGGGSAIVAPFLEFRSDLGISQSGGEPVPFDAVENPLEGRFVELGLYTRWNLAEQNTQFDLELRQAHADELAAGETDGWQPLGVFANLATQVAGVPIGLVHDGRYALEDGDAIFSATSLGAELSGLWGIELSHRRGLDATDLTLYEAASFAARYRWTEKWEWEARQTFSLLDSGTLATRGILRRYGHDLVFEIELSTRSGEGGSSVSFSVKPLIGFNPSEIGVLDPWSY